MKFSKKVLLIFVKTLCLFLTEVIFASFLRKAHERTPTHTPPIAIFACPKYFRVSFIQFTIKLKQSMVTVEAIVLSSNNHPKNEEIILGTGLFYKQEINNENVTNQGSTNLIMACTDFRARKMVLQARWCT